MKVEFGLLFLTMIVGFIESQVRILSPRALKEKFNGPIKASFANFGRIYYGFTFTGRVYYDTENVYIDQACNDLTMKLPVEIKVNEGPIVMINRGSCSFVQKVQNVEKIGGHVALIVNSSPNEDVESVIMSDSNFRKGDQIHIPSLLISHADGQKIKDFFRENRNKEDVLNSIIFEINFEMEHPKNIVKYSFYFSSENPEVYNLLSDLRKYHEALNNTAIFTPYYISNYNKKSTEVMNDCYSKGKFCMSPRFDLNINDGRTILKENIRQKCVFKTSNEKKRGNNQDNAFWDYMTTFFYYADYNQTTGSYANFTDKAGIESLKNISNQYNDLTFTSLVNDCIQESFGLSKGKVEDDRFPDEMNTLFEQDFKSKEENNIWMSSTILINSRTFRGSWTGDNLFEAICAAYKDKPEICYSEYGFAKLNEATAGSGGISMEVVLVIILVVIFVNLAIFLICRGRIKRNINDKLTEVDIDSKINNVVSSYMALKEETATK